MKSYSDILAELHEEGRLRAISTRNADPALIDLSSNDYLGLISDPAFVQDFLASQPSPIFSSGASRLLASRQESYARLEAFLSKLYGKRALLFNSGYHANTGAVSALATPGTLVIADKLAHASIIDGLTLAKKEYFRFRHNDITSLTRLLERHASEAERILVIVESIYSMDGDVAPLRELVALKTVYPGMMLYVDEAHAFGVRGEKGLGLSEELGIIHDIDIIVGTFGKAAASCGAFIAASEEVHDFLVNSARSLIFSTALPPVNIEYTQFILTRIVEMQSRRKHLAAISARFREAIDMLSERPTLSSSQIVPLMAGSNARAIELSEALREVGLLALPIRRPTVPAGTERIRFSLNASISDAELDTIICKIQEALCKLNF